MKYIFLLLALLITGCDSGKFQLANVSGKVSMDGEALEGVQVVFAPMASDGVVEVGPVSIATTDAEGKYTLKTVKGASGVVVTKHRVSIDYPAVSEEAIQAKVDEAYAKNPNMSEQKFLALEQRARQKMANKKSIPKTFNKKTTLRMEVTGPTEDANFDLTSDGA